MQVVIECVLDQWALQRLAGEAWRFFVIDTYREYKYLNELWDNGEARKVWESIKYTIRELLQTFLDHHRAVLT
jgi:hypothetical protein